MTARAPQAPGLRRLAASGVLAGVLAAAGTTAVAALARGLGVSLEAGSVPIPLPAFAFW